MDLTLKAVDATKPSGLIPGEGTITANPLGAIWETSTYHTHTQTRWMITAVHSPRYMSEQLTSCPAVAVLAQMKLLITVERPS